MCTKADDFPGARFQLSLEEDEGKLRSKVSNAVQGRDLHAAGRLAGKRAKAKTGKKGERRMRPREILTDLRKLLLVRGPRKLPKWTLTGWLACVRGHPSTTVCRVVRTGKVRGSRRPR